MRNVTISRDEAPGLDNWLHWGVYCLKMLRTRGIPVIGVMWPEGVETGTLTITTDFFGVTYSWKEE